MNQSIAVEVVVLNWGSCASRYFVSGYLCCQSLVSVLDTNAELCDPAYVVAFVGPSRGKDIAGELVVDSDLEVRVACRWWDALLLESLWAHANASTLPSEGSHVLFSNRTPDTVVFREEFGCILEHIVCHVLSWVLDEGSHSC